MYKTLFFKQNIYYILTALFALTALSGCSGENAILILKENIFGISTPILKLVTRSPFNEKKPTFSLGGLEVGGSIGLYSDENCNNLIQDAIAITAATITIKLSAELENNNDNNNGFYDFYTKQIDSLGNPSE